MTRSLSFLDSATLYAEHGMHVIPVWRKLAHGCQCPRGASCISPGKHPTIDSWQSDGTVEITTIRDWFANPQHNIGIVCGLSGLLVLDIDPRNGGDETLAKLISELGPLPPTVTSQSGGGGLHFLFRRPVGDLVGKFGTEYPGVDVLRDGRQFIVEPSVHPSGGLYRWRAGCAPDEIALAELPAAWIERVQRPKYQAPAPRPITVDDDIRLKRASLYLAKCAPAIANCNGHGALYNATCHVLVGFDLSDSDARSLLVNEYNPRCDPPWSEREIDHKIVSARKTCTRPTGYLLTERPRVTSRQQASTNARPAAPTPDVDWYSLVLTKKEGQPRRCYNNVAVFVRHFPEYHGKWTLDLMTDAPWFDGAPVATPLIHEIRAHIDRRLQFTPTAEDVSAAICAAALERPFHPIRQYLRSLDWDGVGRLSGMAREYLGAIDDHHAIMVRKWMIGCVARALRPGCKLDTALMVVGAQGIGKSTFFAILGGEWHADSFVDITDRDGLMQIHSAWIYELAELENVVHGSKESRLKAWMTTTHDNYRAPYARAVGRKARSVVFCGTTNRERFLTDDTGSRRFWIVPAHIEVPRDVLLEHRDQLWAEAVCAYEQGESWWLDRETDQARHDANAEYQEDDSWVEPVAQWLSPALHEISTTDLLRDALKIDVARHDRGAQMRLARVMRALGWTQERHMGGGMRFRVWRRNDAA